MKKVWLKLLIVALFALTAIGSFVAGAVATTLTGGVVLVHEAITSFQYGADVPENTPLGIVLPEMNMGVYPKVGESTFPAPLSTYIYTGEEIPVIFGGIIKRCRTVVYEGLPGEYVDVSFCNNPD